MSAVQSLLRRFLGDCTGSTVIETAFILPPMLVMSLGAFDVSRMMARQSELQKAANEASDIVLASSPDTDTKKNTVKSVIQTSTGLGANNVTLATVYRCGTDTAFVNASSSCSNGSKVSTYIQLTLNDSYTPMWAKFGVGSGFTYSVKRQVQIS